jgi:hypothetical protein
VDGSERLDAAIERERHGRSDVTKGPRRIFGDRDRPKLTLPQDARIVVWTIVNLEVWDISRPMARQVIPAPTGQVLLPDVPTGAGTNTA